MKFTVLMDNTALPEFLSEHGLSFYIQINDVKILLDAGSSGKFVENAKRLDISLEDIDFAILSHGHYDHSDGFRVFHQINEKAPLYLREEATDSYFSLRTGSPKFVGIHKDIDRNRFCYVKERFLSLADDTFLVGQPECSSQNQDEENLMKIKLSQDNFCEDTFQHQQSLVVVEEEELVIFNSCCHGHVKSIVSDILGFFPNHNRFSLVGGLHLQVNEKNEPLFHPEEVRLLARELKSMGLNRLITGHCTSEFAFVILKEVLGKSVTTFTAGESYFLGKDTKI